MALAPAQMNRPLRILMLEDVATDATLIERELRNAGLAFESVCVETEADFLAKLKEFEPDIVLSDFTLPQFDALEALRLIHARAIKLPFILVTGSQSEETAVACIKEGADDYILKSSLKRLPSAVVSALGKIESERERTRAEQALRHSEEHFRAVIENASDIITILDPAGVILYASPSLERVLGYGRTELIGRNILDFVHPRDTTALRTAFETELRQPGNSGALEYQFLHKDGTWRVLESTCRKLAEKPGLNRIVVNTRDSTERKRTEERIREQAALLDKARDAIFVLDLQNRITFWNKGAERLYGWTATEATGQTADQLLERERTGLLSDAGQAAMETGEWHGELTHLTKAGCEVVVESSWTLVRDAQSNPKALLVINTDVTERKKLESQFLRMQRMESIGTLAGGIAHDLNNVLTPITVAIRMLRDELAAGGPTDILDTLEASAHRGAGIVQQVLSFARGVEGERTLIQVKHPLLEVVTIAKETFPRSIQVGTRINKDLWPVVADATQLHQVFMNLCVNARDAMPHGGRLQIEATNVIIDENYAHMQPDARPGPHIMVTIADTGIGIPPELLNKVFEPFFTTKDVGKGTGLGLSTVLGIVKSHGGFISVFSELGKGTQIKVNLPASTAEHKLTTEAPPIMLPRGHDELVFVADDEFAIRDVLKVTLEINGYRVLTASDGTEVVALYAQRRRPVAVVVDAMMPFMDGLATIRALHKLDPGVRFILMSGLAENERITTLPDIGTVRFLAKPFTTEQLLVTLDQLLHGEPQPHVAESSPTQ